MKTNLLLGAIGFVCVAWLSWPPNCAAQDDRGDWNMTGNDAGQSGWQKGETKLAPDTVAGNAKFLWKIQLGQPSEASATFSEPLLAGRLINARGFKDMVYWSSGDTLYAVDSELGDLLWKKSFKSVPVSRGCGASRLSILMEPAAVINFNARRRRRPPGTLPPPPEEPITAGERRLGVAPGGGYFGLKGIYVLSADGMLHEQVITTGADFAPPVRFLPASGSGNYGLNFMGHEIFTVTGQGCGGVPNGVWTIDLTSSNYPVTHSTTSSIRPLSLTGPVLTSDGEALIVTGDGSLHPGSANYSDSVIAVGKDMKVRDWYAPSRGIPSYEGISPVVFAGKEKQLVVAPGNDGSIALLDAESLGGPDHHTPLAESSPISRHGERHGWDGFAEWQDKNGNAWVFASVSCAVTVDSTTARKSGDTPHGAVIAFKVDESDGKFNLDPVWVSQDMLNPAPPRIANGVVIVLGRGDASVHARLYMLDASTGAELYSSKDEIPTYAGLSGVAVGDGHAFFTDHNNVLYSFGIGMEH